MHPRNSGKEHWRSTSTRKYLRLHCGGRSGTSQGARIPCYSGVRGATASQVQWPPQAAVFLSIRYLIQLLSLAFTTDQTRKVKPQRCNANATISRESIYSRRNSDTETLPQCIAPLWRPRLLLAIQYPYVSGRCSLGGWTRISAFRSLNNSPTARVRLFQMLACADSRPRNILRAYSMLYQ